ncbi:Translation initiation factor IF-2, mitochondrial [Chionoecetes opilio]|uniref:Translation initiation factor IF-2, mitochondrial n=1 Tax=Chionoecetes opilio TaxID=41210 RepID=A0A8J4XNK6_CHIOP|nr:Translation initiation factor IF-2, mitochondrial [Chionoecetes opilio]
MCDLWVILRSVVVGRWAVLRESWPLFQALQGAERAALTGAKSRVLGAAPCLLCGQQPHTFLHTSALLNKKRRGRDAKCLSWWPSTRWKPGADVGRTRRMLLNAGLQLEEQGGEVQAVEVSALTGLNLGRLVEAVVTQAEMLNLRADSTGTVEGVVVESMTDPGRGKVATCVIQRGTLSHGAVLVAGTAWGKVRGMFNDAGKPIKSAPPATPVQVIGWRHLPSAGDVVLEVEGEHRAVEVVEWRETFSKRQQQAVDEIAIQEKLQEHLKHYRAQRDEKRKMGIR